MQTTTMAISRSLLLLALLGMALASCTERRDSERIWLQLENSNWVAEGEVDAPRTLYVFSDPNCPYCHVFWQRVRPWVELGEVQLRHVLVGLISENSRRKGAAILSADNPEKAYLKNERHFGAGGIAPMKHIPANIRSKLAANHELMEQLGLHGTPTIAYRDAEGQVQFWPGLPPDSVMPEILGVK
ncbi:MAG: thiol:disulfide interchange protein DsbG [Salinisphaera sp.]|nr:thiol:disulfide interchange protein DsbG [Salinisphaera sp.]